MENCTTSGDDLMIYAGPPVICDACSTAIEAHFYDCKTVHGPWANLCSECFRTMGVGLGTGRGQQYTRRPDGRYAKTAG